MDTHVEERRSNRTKHAVRQNLLSFDTKHFNCCVDTACIGKTIKIFPNFLLWILLSFFLFSFSLFVLLVGNCSLQLSVFQLRLHKPINYCDGVENWILVYSTVSSKCYRLLHGFDLDGVNDAPVPRRPTPQHARNSTVL